MRRKAEVVNSAPAVPAVPPWGGFFLGATISPPPKPLFAGPQQALLVLGPPRSGKTTSVVVPNLLTAPGAVVTTSTKTDVLMWSARVRSLRGRTWLFDPSGTVDRQWLTSLRWSPVVGCERWEVAVSRAHALASAAQPGRGLGGPDHWTERAEALLGPLLPRRRPGWQDDGLGTAVGAAQGRPGGFGVGRQLQRPRRCRRLH